MKKGRVFFNAVCKSWTLTVLFFTTANPRVTRWWQDGLTNIKTCQQKLMHTLLNIYIHCKYASESKGNVDPCWVAKPYKGCLLNSCMNTYSTCYTHTNTHTYLQFIHVYVWPIKGKTNLSRHPLLFLTSSGQTKRKASINHTSTKRYPILASCALS